MKIVEGDFEDDLSSKDLQRIGEETKMFSFRDLQRLW